MVDLPEGELPWRGSTDEAVLRRRAQYVAGIEYVAQTFGAQQPLQWNDDAAMLVLQQAEPMDLPALVHHVARELWQRVRMDLALKVRIAAHVGRLLSMAEEGVPAGEDVDLCRALSLVAPVNGVTMSEDLALALPEEWRRSVALLGRAEGDERHIYFYPASGAPGARKSFVLDEPERLWSEFREHARGPDVRLIRYAGSRLQKEEPPRLDVRDVFVPPEVETRVTTEQVAPAGATLSISEALRRNQSVIVLGDPGAGKTTLLRWLSVLASSGSYALEARLGLVERLLPLPVSVGRLAEIRRDLGGDGVSLPEALVRYFHDRSLGEEQHLRAFLLRELGRGRCLLLLDGLDEVRVEERGSIRSWIEAFAASHPANRFVATSRVRGYVGLELPGGIEVVLRPLDDERVEAHVRGLHGAYFPWETGQAPSGNEGLEHFLATLRSSERLSSMARNPFILSALVLIHRVEGKLPTHRVQVYERFARALCETLAEARRLAAGPERGRVVDYEEEALPILGELALEMHEQHPGGAAPEGLVVRQLAGALVKYRDVAQAEAERAAHEFLRRASEDVGILLERGAGTWGFLHPTIQEFFVAAGLLAAERFEEVAMMHLLDPRWEEVLRLGVGYLALVQKRPKAAERFVMRVLEVEAPEPSASDTHAPMKEVELAALLVSEVGDAVPVALQKAVAGAMPYPSPSPPPTSPSRRPIS